MTPPIRLLTDDAERLQRDVDGYPDPTACWRWTGPTDSSDRPLFRVQGRRLGAHRVMWVLERKAALHGDTVLRRTCSTRGCVAPHHHERRRREPSTDDGDRRGRGVDLLPPAAEVRAVTAALVATTAPPVTPAAPSDPDLLGEVRALRRDLGVVARALRQVVDTVTSNSKQLDELVQGGWDTFCALDNLEASLPQLRTGAESARKLALMLFCQADLDEIPDLDDGRPPDRVADDGVGEDDHARRDDVVPRIVGDPGHHPPPAPAHPSATPS